MKLTKKQQKNLEKAIEEDISLRKEQRKTIREPAKLCDCCMNEWTYFSVKEEKLCDICYREKYVKTEMG
jgi:hypothetical protein